MTPRTTTESGLALVVMVTLSPGEATLESNDTATCRWSAIHVNVTGSSLLVTALRFGFQEYLNLYHVEWIRHVRIQYVMYTWVPTAMFQL